MEQLTDVICGFLKMAVDSPVLKMFGPDEMELLARKLPPEVLEGHFTHDGTMMEQLLATVSPHSNVDLEAFGAAFRAVYLAALHREELGETYFDQALRLLVRGLALQMM